MRRTLPRKSIRVLGALTAAFAFAGTVAATPAFADPGPNLKVTGAVVPGRYLSGDSVPVDLTITNLGDVPATGVKGQAYRQSGPYLNVVPESWGDLLPEGPGATFAPGETRTYRIVGKSGILAKENPVMQFGALGPGEVDSADNFFVATVEHVPPGTTDRVAGHLYGDTNLDGLPSPGEDLAGAEVHLSGVGMTGELITATDATGRFEFDAVPISPNASVYFSKVPGGWVTPYIGQLRLDGSGQQTALEIKAIRPLTDSLKASIALDKTAYAVGETATATITLTNVGQRAITGLYSGCDPAGNGVGLEVPDAQWGDFRYQNKAGKVAAGERVVLKVTGTVPSKAGAFGSTGLDCWFGNDESLGSGPDAHSTAKVPGQRSSVRVQLWYDKNGNGLIETGEGVANTTVTLTTDGKTLASFARTDAGGFVTFPNLAVGEYRIHFVGPWRTLDPEPTVRSIAPPLTPGAWTLSVVPR